MDVECLYEADPSTDHVSEEMWEGTDNSNDVGYWVETGMAEGLGVGSGRSFFYARNDPTNGYGQWVAGPTANLNQTYGLSIQWVGGTNWAVDINGTNYGEVHYNGTYSESMEAGVERTNDATRAAANFSALSWYNSSGLQENDWSGSGVAVGNGTISVPAAPQSSFSNYYDGTGTCTTDAVSASNDASANPDIHEAVPATPSAAESGIVRSSV